MAQTLKHSIDFLHTDKIFFPQAHLSKGDVIAYYRKIAPYFLALNSHRPIVMQRFIHGITKEGFYQKQIGDYFPAWIDRQKVLLKKGEHQELVVINNVDSLLYLVNQDVLVFHAWLSSVDAVNYPDKIVFDLDPSKDTTIKDLQSAAQQLKKIVENHKLTPFVMTTGSRGYHIVVPIKPTYTFEHVHAYAKKISDELVAYDPQRFTTQVNKEKRRGKIFVDYLRNSYGQTSVAPYSLRAHVGAPVATPLLWSELTKTEPQKYTLKNIFRRLSRVKDPWSEFLNSASRLKI